ncbi:uncharacterized protein LOC107627328 [Arachis ipaensis]|uniref:uncharacterized protein LOC107627328 n=1 Tax=Arachis ipaensis TaxID=130454 RepID=UPI0007AF8AB4|nr:uncharacterized protein LOC107627328 [Arachis ipaensis]
MTIERALCDLGASIKLIPLSMMKKMLIEDVKPTRIFLQLANRSFKIPNGVVENFLVKVGEFIFSANFVILDVEDEGSNSIILGRPFFTTARALIDVEKGELILRVHNDQMVLNVFKAIQYPDELENCMRIDVMDTLVEQALEARNYEDYMEEVQSTQVEEEEET